MRGGERAGEGETEESHGEFDKEGVFGEISGGILLSRSAFGLKTFISCEKRGRGRGEKKEGEGEIILSRWDENSGGKDEGNIIGS